uniref:tRNA (guanine(46)-N(7))-methyltransferase n=2 Tax=Ostreococcus mediterraneus TaxID=1486918 RepID=A0A7S0KJR5_9CHLO|mmetsp:Transcript_5150/g.18745  ORF Transcript_5150/g.18745 Transcript_5150/m.18745 type:complete len:588 (+) Transcript_5150:22-1785(+)
MGKRSGYKRRKPNEGERATLDGHGGKSRVMDDKDDDDDDRRGDGGSVATTTTATTHSVLETSALTALDEGMKRAVKANRKRARDAQTLLKRAMKVKDVKFFNRMIKDFGNDKQFGFAKEAFERISRAGLSPNVYSYTNMMNAAARVGELEFMRTLWDNMALNCDEQANEVTYTVLVKGEAQSGHLKHALGRVREMIACGVEPNARTYSTLLRNCVRYSDVERARECLDLMRERGAAPDATACEYYIKTMCGELLVQQTLQFMRDIQNQDGIEITAASYVALATASSLVFADEKTARNACRDARAAIDVGGWAQEDDNDDKFQQQGDDDSSAPSKSVQLFLQLRAKDALQEIDAVEKYLNDTSEERREEIAVQASSGVERASNVIFVEDAQDMNVHERNARWLARFGQRKDVRVEVCSGHGDWITTRAGRSTDVQWIGVEMRRNRVALTWMKALRLNVSTNITMMCGMAHNVLRREIPDESVQEVYVNYPDPPEWVGSSQVLVDGAFLNDVHRILKPGGYLTCVTDDSTYAMRMCRELAKVPGLFKSTEASGKPFVSGVPDDYGASYFDSMWTNGAQNDRYFIKYSKL